MRRFALAACLFVGALASAQEEALDALRAAGGGVGGDATGGVTRILVLDALTKRPIAGARVQAGTDGPMSVTDARGRADLAVVGVTVTAFAPGYGPTSLGAFPAGLAAIPLWPSRVRKGSVVRLSRDVLSGTITPSTIRTWEGTTSTFMTGQASGDQADQALGALRAVTGALTPPTGLTGVTVAAGALVARLEGSDAPVQLGGGRMDGVASPAFRVVAPAAPDASEWSLVVLLRGPSGAAVGRWPLAGAPPFVFPTPLNLPVVPSVVPDAVALRWSGTPSGAAITTLSIELSDGRVWSVFLAPGAARFDLPGGRPAAFRWTVSHHRLSAFDPAAWTLGGLDPVASSFSLPSVVGAGRFDERLVLSPLGVLYALPEAETFVFESKGRDPWFLTY